jgi:hypothetical protein
MTWRDIIRRTRRDRKMAMTSEEVLWGSTVVVILRQKQRKYVPLPSCMRKGERKYSSYSLLTWTLTLALDGVSGQRHTSAALCLRARTPGTHCTGVCVGPRAGLDTEAREKILCVCRESNPGYPVCSQTVLVYRLSYASSYFKSVFHDYPGEIKETNEEHQLRN